VESENQRQWQNYFLQKPLSDDAPDYIKNALDIIDKANMNEEELEMMTKVEYYQSIYDNQILFARDEGRIEGKNEGKIEGLIQVAIKLLKHNSPIEEIMDITGLEYDEIMNLS
jgi:predicted transposase/invertase (TIGR01784 family)